MLASSVGCRSATSGMKCDACRHIKLKGIPPLRKNAPADVKEVFSGFSETSGG